MNHLNDTMKTLQKVSERLARLNVDGNPWSSLKQMQEILDGDFWNQLSQLARFADDKQANAQEDGPELFVPNIDIFLTPHRVIVCCEAPGLDPGSLEVSLTDHRNLLLKGSLREHEYASYRWKKERYCGKFVRQVTLPVSVTSEGMKTSYQDGLLELRFRRRSAGTNPRNPPDPLDRGSRGG